MRRLIIFLKYVEKKDNKIYNVLSYVIHSDSEKNHYLDMHRGNILKHQTSFFK